MNNSYEVNNTAIILDHGTRTIKADFSFKNLPSHEFSSLVGRSKTLVSTFSNLPATFIGQDCQQKRDFLELSHPIKNGMVQNWDDVQLIWEYLFSKKLKVNPSAYPILLSEHTFNSNKNREKTIQILFETFNTPYAYLANQAYLSLLATDRSTGLVLDSGESQTQCVSIHNGRIINVSIDFLLNGSALTSYLVDLLSLKNYTFGKGPNEIDLIDQIKEKLCCVSLVSDFKLLSNKKFEKELQLDNGYLIKLDVERYQLAEALFQPSLINLNTSGFHVIISQCIAKTDIENKNDLFENIILSGGNTMFPVIGERLKKELVRFNPNVSRFQVDALPQRKYLSWIGGAKLANGINFRNISISRSEYDEYGANIVHKKC